MPNVNKRRGEGRNFDYFYDPNFITATQKDTEKARRAAQRNTAIVKPYTKYSTMFMDGAKVQRTNNKKEEVDVAQWSSQDSSSASSSKTPKYAPYLPRLHAGENDPNVRKVHNVITSPSECTKKAPGFEIRPRCPKVHFSEVRLSHNVVTKEKQRYLSCQQFMSKLEVRMYKTRGTQSLYRESSAQTLPYLPGVANQKDEVAEIELFKLPTILPGDGPPGIYEVEVLERARKRWAFARELKITFRRQLESARERRNLQQQKTILEAFEWQHWIEREEYIQECQMIRLELLIGLLNKREQSMHKASKSRIEQSYEQIAARRDAALRKNEVEYGRQMRQLIFTRDRVPRRWRRESIVHLLGSPNSDYYGPQQRYGVNPADLHFTPKRKQFEHRTDDLEKRVSETAKLVCPYAKLKEWSKPKKRFLEIEQNFCSDDNLRKMYESLTTLRKESKKVKAIPKCLITKLESKGPKPHLRPEKLVDYEVCALAEPPSVSESMKIADEGILQRQRDEAFRLDVIKNRQYIEFIQAQQQIEETDTLLSEYEGSTIGWLMRFLSEELSRKQEQHILSYLAMLARKERWRREAAEVGLRQKENEMREIYEQLYTKTHTATGEICREYLNTFMIDDVPDYTDFLATKVISDLATTVDMDTQRWLDSIACIQNPLNFDKLRYRLKDIMFPELENILRKKEIQFVIDYIIEDVVLHNVFGLLEPFDIGCFTANETIDRVIDNDLYYFSSEDNSSTCSCLACECGESEREAKAILRKAIRQSVPGRRWKYPNERIALNTTHDILDDVIGEAEKKTTTFQETDNMDFFWHLCPKPSLTDLFNPKISTPLELPDRRLTNEHTLKITKSEHFKPRPNKASKKRKTCEHKKRKEEEQHVDEFAEEESSMSFIQAIIEDIGGLVEDDEAVEESQGEIESLDGSALRLILKQVYKVINPSEEEESKESFVDDEDEGDEEDVNSPSSFEYKSVFDMAPAEIPSDEVMFLENDGQILTYMPLAGVIKENSSNEQSEEESMSGITYVAEDETEEVHERELTPRAETNDERNAGPAAEIMSKAEIIPGVDTIPEAEAMLEAEDNPTTETNPETETLPEPETSPEGEDAPAVKTMSERKIMPKAEAVPTTDVRAEAEALAVAETIPETEALLAAPEEETVSETTIESPETEQQSKTGAVITAPEEETAQQPKAEAVIAAPEEETGQEAGEAVMKAPKEETAQQPKAEAVIAAPEEETGQETTTESPETEQQPKTEAETESPVTEQQPVGGPKVVPADDAEEESITEIEQNHEALGDDMEQPGQAKREESEIFLQQELPAETEQIAEAELPTRGTEPAEAELTEEAAALPNMNNERSGEEHAEEPGGDLITGAEVPNETVEVEEVQPPPPQ